MDWFTADLHLCHTRPFIYEPRGFNSVKEMNDAIVRNFQEVIKWDDKLYILGDLMLNDNDGGLRLLRQIPGEKYIIYGNHDTTARIDLYKTMPNATCLGLAAYYKHDGFNFFLSHYPTATSNFDDNKTLKARVHNLSGHTHSKELWDARTNSYNVALDAHNNYPVSIEDIISDIKRRYKDEV